LDSLATPNESPAASEMRNAARIAAEETKANLATEEAKLTKTLTPVEAVKDEATQHCFAADGVCAAGLKEEVAAEYQVEQPIPEPEVKMEPAVSVSDPTLIQKSMTKVSEAKDSVLGSLSSASEQVKQAGGTAMNSVKNAAQYVNEKTRGPLSTVATKTNAAFDAIPGSATAKSNVGAMSEAIKNTGNTKVVQPISGFTSRVAKKYDISVSTFRAKGQQAKGQEALLVMR